MIGLEDCQTIRGIIIVVIMFGGVLSDIRRRLSSSADAALSVDDEVTQHNNNPATGLRFTDLPPDILYTIVSKLPAKEVARSSVLSSEWRRCMRTWSACPRLTFDAATICKCERHELSETTQVARFIPHVNGVLQKHRSCVVVETLELRTDFVGGADGRLAHHIHNWVEFAVSSSRTKNLSLDLKPQNWWWEHDESGVPRTCQPRKQDLYVFPFQKLLSAVVSDNNTTNWGSSLQRLHLSYVSFRPPSQFKGFPNLRKLHLEVLHISREDLEHLLSRCAKIQWLHINRCVVDDQLTLTTPLPSLLYLNVEYGVVTKIDINAANLATFEYSGRLVPIRLVHSLSLKSANLDLSMAVLEHALISLVNGIPSLQSLTSNLKLGLKYLEKQWSWDHPLKRFSNLRHLQLLLNFYQNKHVDKLLYSSVSFLRAAPLIEKLEVHFCGGSNLWFAQGGPSRKDLIGRCKCKYNQLKNVWVSGFKATKGQLEFLLHVIENADALEVLRVEIGQYTPDNSRRYGDGEPPVEEAKQIARTTISAILPQHVTLDIVR